MLGYEGKASINEVDQVRQRKGSWPVWIDLQKEGIRGNIANNSSHSHSKYHIPYLLRNLLRKRRQHRRMPRTWTVGPHWGLWTFWRRCSLLPGNRVTILELILESSESMPQTVRWICFIICKKEFFFRAKSTPSGTWGPWEITTLSRQKIFLSVLPVFLVEIQPQPQLLFFSRLLNSADSGGRRLTFLETPRPG